MAAQAIIDQEIDRLIAEHSRHPGRDLVSISPFEARALLDLLPGHATIALSYEGHNDISRYHKVLSSLQEISEGKDGILTVFGLILIKSITPFSREGVKKDENLSRLILMKLDGDEADFSETDRRLLTFNKRRLVEAGYAKGITSLSGAKIELNLISLTERGGRSA